MARRGRRRRARTRTVTKRRKRNVKKRVGKSIQSNWKKISEIDQLDWVPLKIKWANKNEFIVKTTSVTNYLENGPDIKQNFEFRRYQVSENNVAEMVYNIK